MSPGPSTLAIEASGEDEVRDAFAQTLERFRLSDGRYRLENSVHCLIATAWKRDRVLGGARIEGSSGEDA